jgi:hypothetical protein
MRREEHDQRKRAVNGILLGQVKYFKYLDSLISSIEESIDLEKIYHINGVLERPLKGKAIPVTGRGGP